MARNRPLDPKPIASRTAGFPRSNFPPTLRSLGVIAALPFFLTSARALGQGNARPSCAELIEQLKAESFSDRLDATVRLYDRATECREALQEAMQSSSFEVSARAHQILVEMEGLPFLGAQIRLSISPQRLAWDQPAEIVVEITNPTSIPMRLPLTPPSSTVTSNPGSASEIESQVENALLALDLADYLVIEDPSGEVVNAVVDDVSDEPLLKKALDLRLQVAPQMMLPPGRTLTLKLGDFNRGWVRFPLLIKGRYALSFEYQPSWADGEGPLYRLLAERGACSARSAAVALEVTSSAPDGVQAQGPRARLELVDRGATMDAEVTATCDVPVWVNASLGDLPHEAHLTWIVEQDDLHAAFAYREPAPANGASPSAPRLALLQPGERLTLLQVDKAQLWDSALRQLPLEDRPARVRLRYSNLLSRGWRDLHAREQARLGAPLEDPLAGPLPYRIVTERLESDSVAIAPPAHPAETPRR